MIDEPFWMTMSPEQLRTITARVVYRNGVTYTGPLKKLNDSIHPLLHSATLPRPIDFEGMWVADTRTGSPRFIVKSIELVDSRQRIERIEDVREGDTVVTDEGNRFPVIGTQTDPTGDPLLRIRIREIGEEYVIGSTDFAYALRHRQPLPKAEGLYRDTENRLWSHDANNHTWRIIRAKNGTYVNNPKAIRKETITSDWTTMNDGELGVPEFVLPLTPVTIVKETGRTAES